MDTAEALNILGVHKSDTPDQVRKQYHRLMHTFHPDASGADQVSSQMSNQRTQQIIEAYRHLKRMFLLEAVRENRDYGIRKNEQAFCSRTLYMNDDLAGADMLLDTGMRGRFYWDPEVESFQLLLKSVAGAVSMLAEDCPVQTRAKLLHLLLQEFVDPYACIGLLYPAGADGMHSVRCHLKAVKQMKQDAADFQVRAAGNRLYAYEGSREAGQVTFDQNELYYVITPLFLQNAVSDAVFVPEKAAGPKVVRGVLRFRTDFGKQKDLTRQINVEIAKTLRYNS